MDYRNQLQSILQSSGWSQEQLAHALAVSFPTLNAWVNQRARPRRAARLRIEQLYLDIVGAVSVDEAQLAQAKEEALQLKLTAQDLVTNKRALDTMTLHLTYHTNTIEGSTMTLSDVEQVIFEQRTLSDKTAIEQAEARNHQAALLWLLDQLIAQSDTFSITEQLILELHLRLMNSIQSDAGRYRRHAVRIMGTHVPIANWQRVPERMSAFIADLQNPAGDVVSQLAKSHATFEQIHPFSDGNGRTGRLLMLAQALHAHLVPPLVVKERRHAYYRYLEFAQTRNAYQPLELFIAQSMRYCNGLLTDTKTSWLS